MNECTSADLAWPVTAIIAILIVAALLLGLARMAYRLEKVNDMLEEHDDDDSDRLVDDGPLQVVGVRPGERIAHPDDGAGARTAG